MKFKLTNVTGGRKSVVGRFSSASLASALTHKKVAGLVVISSNVGDSVDLDDRNGARTVFGRPLPIQTFLLEEVK